MSMTLKAGKFYKDGQPVPLEFGNKEQIAVLDRVRCLIRDGEEPSMYETDQDQWVMLFDCVCGAVVHCDIERDDMDGTQVICKCGLVYHFKEDADCELTIYLKK